MSARVAGLSEKLELGVTLQFEISSDWMRLFIALICAVLGGIFFLRICGGRTAGNVCLAGR